MRSKKAGLVMLLGIVLAAAVLPTTMAAGVSSPSITISISPSYPSAPHNFTIYGNVTVGSGSVVSGTSVAVQILASNGSLVESAAPPVIGTGASGTYSQNFTTAPATAWAGSYVARPTYTFEGATASASLNFTVAVCVCGPVTTATVTATTPPTLVYLVSPVISQGFVNLYPSALSVYMWADVLNPSGQTAGVYLGSANLVPSANTTVGAVLFNLPSGNYTAMIFVTTTSGVVVSTTSTMRSFTV